jgi:uncharacterized protein (TIGR03067 family)
MRWSLLALLVVTGFVRGDPAPNEAVKKEVDRLQGTWVPRSSITEGVAAKQAELDVLRLIIKGDRWSYSIGGGPSILQPEPRFVVDPSANPRTLDVLSVKDKGKSLLRAIYEVDGDTLKVCFTVGNAERPREFKSAAGSKSGVTVYERMKR